MEYIIYATGIMIFFLLYIAFKISDSPYDKILRMFLILLVAGLFIILAKGVIDNSERCFPVVNESIDVSSTTTHFVYTKYCYEESHNTPLVLYKWVTRLTILLASAFIVYLFYWTFSFFIQKNKGKK